MSDEQRYDLHTHSRFSIDSRARVQDILDRASVAGLSGVALTDHNTVSGHARLKDLKEAYPRLLLIPGVEVSTSDGHLLVYGVAEVPPVGRPLPETVEWVSAHSGVSVLAHPFRWAHGAGRALAETARVQGIESANGHNADLANAKAELISAQRGLGSTGGSDAHDAASVGRAYTTFREDVGRVDDLLELLRRGHCRGIGRSLTGPERVWVPLRSLGLRIGRGFRPI